MGSLVDTWQADDRVFALAISPDGARLGAAVRKTVMIWDLHTGQVALGPLRSHANYINSVAFSPDGRFLASASSDRTIRIWDAETGRTALRPLTRHTNYVRSVTFSPNGRLLISGSLDETIRLWDTLTGQPIRKPIRAGSEVNSVVVSPDGARIYGALSNKTIKAYDMDTSALLLTFAGHESAVFSLAVSPDGRRIVSGSNDNTVRFWDAATAQAISDPPKGHTSHVVSVAFSPDGQYVASGSDDRNIWMWNAETGAMLDDPLHGHTSSVYAVMFAPDSTRLISGSLDHTILVWDVHNPSTQPPSITLAEQQAQLVPVEDEIAGTTTLEEIIARLRARGCPDLTDQLDITTCSTFPISSGGFGDIFRGDLENGVKVAIKTIRLYVDSEEDSHKHRKYVARELYTWSKCRHANIQPLLGLVKFRGMIGMVAAWESNGNLPQYLKRHPDADRCILATLIAKGLLYLHASGVVHGDLKGANILVSQDGNPQLADFGNAKLQEYTLQFTKISTKEVLSSRWAAPELFEGTKCSVLADVYALGMTILEAITGEVPWMGKSERGVMLALMVLKTHPERPEECIPSDSDHGDRLWSLLKTCWDFEPEKRPTAAKVRTIMSRITQQGLKRN